MKNPLRMALLGVSIGIALSACTESPQTASSGRKSDTRASEGPGSAYSASGWKAGDAASWELQMRVRSQGQNEYVRTGPQ